MGIVYLCNTIQLIFVTSWLSKQLIKQLPTADSLPGVTLLLWQHFRSVDETVPGQVRTPRWLARLCEMLPDFSWQTVSTDLSRGLIRSSWNHSYKLAESVKQNGTWLHVASVTRSQVHIPPPVAPRSRRHWALRYGYMSCLKAPPVLCRRKALSPLKSDLS